MRGDKILNILETVKEISGDSIQIIEAFLMAGYGASSRKVKYKLNEIQNKAKERNYKIKCKDLIYRLKRDGLIEENKEEKRRFFTITKKGNKKIIELKNIKKDRILKKDYEVVSSERFSIVVFDVPETERRKRDWIRAVLKKLKFNMIQKSVWIGKIKIPRKFVNDLVNLKMTDYVEIFEISKTGSLKHII